MPRVSAGILMHRVRGGRREVLLVHPGGPFWVNKDEGTWSIPKGQFEPPETAIARGLATSRTSTFFRHSSTPARRDSCGPQESIRSATCEPTVPRPMRPTLSGRFVTVI